jgi:hypothetical protein
VRGHLRRIVRCIRAHWPTTKITIRGDGHYGRREVMDWCEDNGLDYVFGLPGNKILAAAVEDKADDIRTRRALEQAPVLRGYTQTNYAAKSWKVERRVCARIEVLTNSEIWSVIGKLEEITDKDAQDLAMSQENFLAIS